jgi:hypothetical protein
MADDGTAPERQAQIATLLAELRARGLLLLQDRALANAVTMLAGEAVAGSWWAHPAANRMYAILEAVTEHPDVLVTKLIAGKLTFVDRALWPSVLAVANAREPWQLAGLSAAARRLLETIDDGESMEPAGAGAKELELRLLAHARSVHTPSGKHVTRLEPWSVWAASAHCRGATNLADAKRRLAVATVGIGGTEAQLPFAAQVSRRG